WYLVRKNVAMSTHEAPLPLSSAACSCSGCRRRRPRSATATLPSSRPLHWRHEADRARLDCSTPCLVGVYWVSMQYSLLPVQREAYDGEAPLCSGCTEGRERGCIATEAADIDGSNAAALGRRLVTRR